VKRKSNQGGSDSKVGLNSETPPRLDKLLARFQKGPPLAYISLTPIPIPSAQETSVEHQNGGDKYRI
jgi:hypothetical protein